MRSQLIEAIAADGERLRDAAMAIGGMIAFSPHRALTRDIPSGLERHPSWSPNRHCRLIEACGGSIAVNLAREEDRRTIPALTGSDSTADPWQAMRHFAAQHAPDEVVRRGIELHLPIARVGEFAPRPPQSADANATRRTRRPRAIDLSALWAGPYCGGLLAEAGVDVCRIESTTRPDPTPRVSPVLDHRLNGRKTRRHMNPSDPALIDLIADSDILITSARRHALARLGLSENRLFTLNPDLIWVAITAYGWTGDAGMRVGFGDDCAAAGGLVGWRGEKPYFLGDALADPLSGMTAATHTLEWLASGASGVIDIALAQVAARMAERLTWP